MPLVPAKCPACGDTIEVDKAKEAAICPSCGSAFIVEKAIQVFAQVYQAENMIINNGDGVTRDNCLNAALKHAQNKDYAKAIDAIDDAMKRGKVGALFTKLRSVLTVLNHDQTIRITAVGLIDITNDYRDALLIGAKNEDTSVSPEMAYSLLQRLGMTVFNGWLEFIEKISPRLRNQATCSAARKEVNSIVDYIVEYLAWAKSAGQLLKVEQDAYPLRSRSFWAEMMRHLLERLALNTDPQALPTAQEAQRIYDLAEEYMEIKGLFRKRSFAPCVIPLHKGGEGVYARVKDEVKGDILSGVIVHTSISEYEYCELKAKEKTSDGIGFYIGSCLIPIAILICMAIHYVLAIMEVLAVLAYLVRCVCIQGTIPRSVYEDWLKSPARGTKAPETTYEEFLDWMKKNAEAKKNSTQGNETVTSK